MRSVFTIFILSFIMINNTLAQKKVIERIEPPSWWVGMKNTDLQLLVYGKNISDFSPEIKSTNIKITKVSRSDSKNYLFIDLDLSRLEHPEKTEIVFKHKGNKDLRYNYEFKQRIKDSEKRKGFNSSDVIYLITPDRFANSDTLNDINKNLRERTKNRKDDYARHGGDINGITDHLDYIDEMGFTVIWPTPVLINDMKKSSYHGYAMTDFYRVDPRFGTLKDYIELSRKAKERGIKLIMDQVVNHCGIEHWWMKDLPFKNWINYQKEYENGEFIVTNHHRTVNQDPYASEKDKELMTHGWFVPDMPDLNQKNPFLAKYLIQNSIWWIETLDLAGIRQDTYPYSDKDFISHWAGSIMQEYPQFSIVGEEWSYNPLLVGYWLDGAKNKDGYRSHLGSTMDFPMLKAIVEGLNEKESWEDGLIKMYEGLANDFSYSHPEKIIAFLDNHDKSRIYTEFKKDLTLTKMALSYLLILPRTPQIYYGTEVLMNDSEKPGDHGLIRSDFPGGWENDKINAFTGKGLSKRQKEMQDFLKRILNYRKNSLAISKGKTLHFAPEEGIYVIFRIFNDETVVLILNKNKKTVDLNLSRFGEAGLDQKKLKNILNDEVLTWDKELKLKAEGCYLFTTKF